MSEARNEITQSADRFESDAEAKRHLGLGQLVIGSVFAGVAAFRATRGGEAHLLSPESFGAAIAYSTGAYNFVGSSYLSQKAAALRAAPAQPQLAQEAPVDEAAHTAQDAPTPEAS